MKNRARVNQEIIFPFQGTEFRNVVAEFASRHGLRSAISAARRGQDGMVRITVAFEPPAPEGRNDAEREWNRRAESLGLQQEWLGRSFRYRGTISGIEHGYTVIGLQVEPFVRVLLLREDGETSATTVEHLKEFFA
jgi:hypothetical protein